MPRKTVLKAVVGKPVSPIGRRRAQKNDQWGGFVQCDIGEVEREQFDEWRSGDPATAAKLVVDALAVGLKLTFVWDGANECFIASFTGRPDFDGAMEFTATLSARAGDMQTVLELLVYKHVEVMGEDWRDWLVNGVKTKRNFG